MTRLWTYLVLILVPLHVFAAGNESVNTLPINSSNQPNAAFFQQLRTFLNDEVPDRDAEQSLGRFVVSGGIHATAGTMVSPTFATIAYTEDGNRVNQASTTIDYSAAGCAAADTAWVVVSANAASTIDNFNRVGSTDYFVDCTSATLPTLPDDSAWLMQVTIAGSAITAVVDRRSRIFTSSVVEAVSYTTATDVIWRFDDTGMVCPNNGITITFRGRGMERWPRRQLFCEDGASATYGTVTFGVSPAIYMATPLWWGAAVDGATDDVNAFNAATAASNAASVPFVVPQGTTTLGAAGRYYSLQHLLCESGNEQCILDINHTGNGLEPFHLGAGDSTEGYRSTIFENLYILRRGSVGTGTGLRISHMRKGIFRNLRIVGFDKDIDFTTGACATCDSFFNHFDNIELSGGTTSCLIIAGPTDPPNANYFSHGDWRGGVDCVDVSDGATMDFENISVQGASSDAIRIRSSATNTTLLTPRFENSTETVPGTGINIEAANSVIIGGSSSKMGITLHADSTNGELTTGVTDHLHRGTLLTVGRQKLMDVGYGMRGLNWAQGATTNGISGIGLDYNALIQSDNPANAAWTKSGSVTIGTLAGALNGLDAREIAFGTTAGTTPSYEQPLDGTGGKPTITAASKTVWFGQEVRAPILCAYRLRIFGDSGITPETFTTHPVVTTEWREVWAKHVFTGAATGNVNVQITNVNDSQDCDTIHTGNHWVIVDPPTNWAPPAVRRVNGASAQTTASLFRARFGDMPVYTGSGVVVPITAAGSAVADSDFPAAAGTPPNGTITVDTTNQIPFVRLGAATHSMMWASDRATVASATSIAINGRDRYIILTGTTNIRTINTCSSTYQGKDIILEFNTSITIENGTGNIKSGSDFAGTADDTMHLVCDGTNWRELSRKAN